MTIYGHHERMTRVRVAELKAGLSRYLRKVTKGHTVEVLQRNIPIARITPLSPQPGLVVRKAIGNLHDVKLPPPLSRSIDAVELLLADRRAR